MPLTRAATTDIEWDFSDFTVQTSLAGESGVPNYTYNGLILVGAQTTEQKDYVTTEGVHFNGATKSGQRCLVYTPSLNGRLTVSYKSNNSTARGCYISEEISISNYIAVDTDTVGSVTARLYPGKTYYICCDGGITITHVMFNPF